MSNITTLFITLLVIVSLSHNAHAHRLHAQRSTKEHVISKRNILNFDELPQKKWQMPIKYYIDISFYADVIREAIHKWENATCIKFQEVKDDTRLEERHLYFKTGLGCSSEDVGMASEETNMESNSYSYGDTDKYRQIIILGSSCLRGFEKVGNAMHEIGHALGLYHTMQRLDRDQHVKIVDSNIPTWISRDDNYNLPNENIKDDNISYDLGSIMQYPGMIPSTGTDVKFDILPIKENKIFVLGQSVEITFSDAKIINTEYCTAEGSVCKHGGYIDPKDADKCRCPPEWTGRHCQRITSGTKGCSPHSGRIKHNINDYNKDYSLLSPNYLSKTTWSFTSGDQCFWIIKVPHHYQIGWWLSAYHSSKDVPVYFGMYMNVETASCQTWLEIRTPNEMTGRRICGLLDEPNHLGNSSHPVLSHSHQLHISFRSFDVIGEHLPMILRRGFHLKYKMVKKNVKYDEKFSVLNEVQYFREAWKRIYADQIRTTTSGWHWK